MNVARGIFRLWLILTSIWVIIVGGVVFVSWPVAPSQSAPMFDDLIPSVAEARSTLLVDAGAAILCVSGAGLLGILAGMWIADGFRRRPHG